jgi:hypothetical protein
MTPSMLPAYWALLAVALVAAGCASGPGKRVPALESTPKSVPTRASPPAPRYNLTGYSAAFKEGFADACARHQDEQRYETDMDYQMGWSDGRSLCNRR